jgi:hypothetical protein
MFWADTGLANGPVTNYDISLKWDKTSIDTAKVGYLDQGETIAGNWVNTANPWADNEITSSATWNAKTQDDDTTSWLASKTDIRHEATYELFKGAASTSTKWYTMADGTNMSSTIGITMPAAGYVWAVSQRTNVSAETTPGTYYARIMAYRAASNQWTWDVYDTTGGVAVYGDWATNSNPATYSFQAGDILNGTINWGTFVGTITGTWTWVTVRFTTPQGQ